ncbi:MAG: hypothetical protein GY725_14340 [bacterium]|nr:hypothetical protein [bacterium]
MPLKGTSWHKALVALVAWSLTAFLAAGRAEADPWPGDSGVEIGDVGGVGGLPSGYEPSGAVWHTGLGVLLVVGDGGQVSEMDADGTNVITWSPGGDLEGITIADPDSDLVYLAREHPDAVLEFNLRTGTLTGNSWDLTAWLTGSNNQGLEALTYADGLFYAGLQADGNIYVFQLLPLGAVNHIETLPAPFSRTDISGLHFDADTEILYATYDSSDVIVEMQSDGTFLREYDLAGNDQEGIALLPGCPTGDATLFISEDSAEVWRYEDYPITCVAEPIPALKSWALALLAAALGFAGVSRPRAPRMNNAFGNYS